MLQLRCVTLWTVILLLLESCAVQAGTVAVLRGELDHADIRVVEESPSLTSQQQPYPLTSSLNPGATTTDASVAFLSDGSTSDHSSTTPLVVGGAVAGTASLAVVGVLSLVLRRRQSRARMAHTHDTATGSSAIASTTTVVGLTHKPQKRDRSRPRLPRMRSLTVLSSIGHASVGQSVASDSLTSPALSCFSAYDDPFSSAGSTREPCSASHIQVDIPKASVTSLLRSLEARLDTPSTPPQLAGTSSESETHLHEEDIVAASLSRARYPPSTPSTPSPAYLPPSFKYPTEDFSSSTDSRSSLSLVHPHTYKTSETRITRDPECGL